MRTLTTDTFGKRTCMHLWVCRTVRSGAAIEPLWLALPVQVRAQVTGRDGFGRVYHETADDINHVGPLASA